MFVGHFKRQVSRVDFGGIIHYVVFQLIRVRLQRVDRSGLKSGVVVALVFRVCATLIALTMRMSYSTQANAVYVALILSRNRLFNSMQ